MKAEIMTVGTELLMGQIVNTNFIDISRALLGIGVGTYYQTVLGDNLQRLIDCVKIALSRSDLLILAGGIGPTDDDITKFALSELFHYELIEDPWQAQRIHDYFAQQNSPMTPNNMKQALSFKEATTLENHVGLACGLFMKVDYENQQKYIGVLPGPPLEMNPMLESQLIPIIKNLQEKDEVIESEYIQLYGIGESKVATIISDIINEQSNPTIAIYAKPRKVSIRVTASAASSEAAKLLLNETLDKILSRFSDEVIGLGENLSIEQANINQLREKQLTLSLAESLTGGLVMDSLISIPGASQVIAGGFVTYQSRMKEILLKIDPQVIEEYSVVSSQVAELMAEHCLKLTGTDIAVSLTGVAGPDPLEGYPPGKVFIGLAQNNQATLVKELNIQYRSRDIIRQVAKEEALMLIRQVINN